MEMNEMSSHFAKKYGAPILIPYVRWILELSIQNGIKKLYFIARDGYVLKKIADILVEKNHYSIETSYLYGSRKAWRKGFFFSKDFSVKEYLDQSYRDRIVSLKKLSAIFGLSEDEISEFLPDHYKKCKEDWSLYDVYIIQNILEKSSEFKICLKNKHEQAYLNARMYLSNEIDKDIAQIAFVESVGTGYTLASLSSLIDSEVSSLNGFFYYQHKKAYDAKFYSYIDNEWLSSIQIELLCRSCEGQTEGYEIGKDGNAHPVFHSSEEKNLIEYGYMTYINTLCDIASNEEELYQYDENIIKQYLDIKEKQELKYISCFPYGVLGVEKKICTFAPKMNWVEFYKMIKYGTGYYETNLYKGGMFKYTLRRLNGLQKVIKNTSVARRISEKNKYSKEINRLDNKYSLSKVVDLTGKRIAVYGGGKIGKAVIDDLEHEGIEVVALIDRNDIEYRRWKSTPIEQLNFDCFDYIVVAVINEKLRREISYQIKKAGIPERKIAL